MEQKTVTIQNHYYTLVKNREDAPVSIFFGNDSFLRLGAREVLEPELNFHKKLLQYGFPVPQVIEEGFLDNKFYYSETSLGNQLLGDLFWEDYRLKGQISKKHFEETIKVSIKFAEAQFKTAKQTPNNESFYLGIRMDKILRELPHLKDKAILAFEKAKWNTKDLPFVLTHGDFNTYNLFANGVIDFGSSFEAPVGYDLISNICHTYLFPSSGDYESLRRYQFSPAQITEYFKVLDNLFISNDLPRLSNFVNDFTFCRAIWATVSLERFPKVQQWRYKKFEQILSDYLENRPIFEQLIDS